MSERIVIDGLSLLFREFHALLELKNKSGWGTGMAFGVLKHLLMLYTKHGWHSGRVILAWDRKPIRKLAIYPEYKAKRKSLELPELMSVPAQIKITQKMLEFLGMNQAYCDGEESDDVCATLAAYFSAKGHQVTIISSDHDLFQCLTPTVSLLMPGKVGDERYTHDKFMIKYEIEPWQYARVLALGGCKTDNVCGMRGISEETAAKVVKQNEWLSILTNAQDLVFPTKRSETAFRKNHATWDHVTMRKLVYLRRDLRPTISAPVFDAEKLKQLFYRLEFKQYLQMDNFDRICEVFRR